MEAPGARRFFQRLAAFTRLILFDQRGSGLSDSGAPYTLEQDSGDALAVLDAAGSERAAVLTLGLAGPVAALLAAEHPDRISALIMYQAIARSSWAPGYEWAMTREQRDELAKRDLASWPCSTGLHRARCIVREPSPRSYVTSAWRSAWASTPASVS